ncbi:hypothetical protein L1987_73931 [Smallanthus sonchifolius]|uniref:Uncharacterized protein n=1 Tax=Smallanthus sonchifolius TaxID=185202 RepID=A0ACB9A1M6_9ASTR|nr:hypothetical protein L1987_73931 [Smallanthus sonchifolius]
MLRKCKTLSRQLVGTSSSANRRSKSSTAGEPQADTGGIMWKDIAVDDNYGGDIQLQETVFVGSTRKRYVIDSKYLSHPLVNALIGKSTGGDGVSVVNCEVVLFDHLLWMVESSDLSLSSDSWAELADLYCVD